MVTPKFVNSLAEASKKINWGAVSRWTTVISAVALLVGGLASAKDASVQIERAAEEAVNRRFPSAN